MILYQLKLLDIHAGSNCGFVVEKLPLEVRSWNCPSCGTIALDRDINAGKNILAAGLAVSVCGAKETET